MNRVVAVGFMSLRFIEPLMPTLVERAQGHEATGEAIGQPGLVATVKHLRGEGDLPHASLQDFREENGYG